MKYKLILAPMDGFTNVAFRTVCHNLGADLVCTEMVNANALAINNKATIEKAFTVKEESPVSVQLFGTKLDHIKKAVGIIDKFADVIDFNMGCPVRRVLNQGAGSALLKRPKKIQEIIETLVSSTDKPVSVKIRSNNALRNAKIIEKAGASFITLHARTVQQGYSGKADWDLIKEVKDSLQIPLVGNGDITNELEAERMLQISDAAMIGRKALRDPLIFKKIKHYLKNNEFLKTSLKDKVDAFIEYLKLANQNNIKFAHMKNLAIQFSKGFEGSKNLRIKLIKTKNKEEVARVFLGTLSNL